MHVVSSNRAYICCIQKLKYVLFCIRSKARYSDVEARLVDSLNQTRPKPDGVPDMTMAPSSGILLYTGIKCALFLR